MANTLTHSEKQALVFATSEHYAWDTVASVQSCIELGSWSDPEIEMRPLSRRQIIVIIYTDTEASPHKLGSNLLSKPYQLLSDMGCTLLHLDLHEPFRSSQDAQLSHLGFLKNHLFTHPLFKSFDLVHFIDSDTYCIADLQNSLGGMAMRWHAGKAIAFRGNPNKGTLYEVEFGRKTWPNAPVPNCDIPFATCLFSIKMDCLPSTNEIQQRFENAVVWSACFHFYDQSLYNIAFSDLGYISPWTTSWSDSKEPQPSHLFIHTGGKWRGSRDNSPFHDLHMYWVEHAKQTTY